MDFKKKIKIRIGLAVSYIVLGIAMIVVFNLVDTGVEFLSSMGFAVAVIGIARLRQYSRLIKDDALMKKQEVRENDERNVGISEKARAITLTIYVLVACLAVIVLQVLKLGLISTIVSGSVCLILVIYWITYLILRKKS